MSYARELNKGMKVFSQLYVGLKIQRGTECYLGFATPFEKNSAFNNRKGTVDGWAKNIDRMPVIENGECVYDENGRIKYKEPKSIESQIIENVPRQGFKITDDVKRVYWGGGNVVWRVYDPAGFELEIQSQNLMSIIQSVGLTEGGGIPGKCIWGRSGKDNILLHETSEEYKNAILAAENLKKPCEVSLKNKIIGAKYLLQTGIEATYLGKFWVTAEHYDIKQKSSFKTCNCNEVSATDYLQRSNWFIDSEQFEVVLIGDISDLKECTLNFYKKAPLARRLDENSIDINESLSLINSLSSNNKTFASSSITGKIVHVSVDKVDNLKYVPRPISDEDFDKAINGLIMSWKLTHLVEKSTGNFKSPISVLSLFFFYGSRFDRFGVLVDNVYYSGECSNQNSYLAQKNAWNKDVIFEFNSALAKNEISDKGDVTNTYQTEDFLQSTRYPHFKLPNFNNIHDMKAWCIEMHANKMFANLVVKAGE